jgi:hypothetical protein
MKRSITLFAVLLTLLSMTALVFAQDDMADEIVVDQPGFFPESVAVYAGVLYTSNFATAEILAINMEDGSTTTLAPAQEGKAGWGLYVDEISGVLLSCVAGAGEPFGGVAPTTPNEVNAYSLETDELLMTWTLESGIVCNSITTAGDNTIMISNIVTPQIIKLDTETGESSVWSAEAAYAVEGGFGISGLVWDGARNLYAVSNGRLFRVPMNDDGTAGAAVEVALTDEAGEAVALGTDGLVWAADGVMVGAENDVFVAGANGRALRVTLGDDDSAVVDVLAEGLADPSAITAVTMDDETHIIVANSQMGYMFGVDQGEAPNASFVIVPLN